MHSITKYIPDESAMLALGAQLAAACGDTAVIFLSGQLGAGKTTLSRGFLQGLGHPGKVKSPTYTLVEPYEIAGKKIFHFDFYRVRDPRELDFIGIEDYFVPQAICLVEWPEQGQGFIPLADLFCYLEQYESGRKITMTANTERGKMILQRMN